MIAVEAQPFTVRLGSMAEASLETTVAGPIVFPMRLGAQAPTPTPQIQASHLIITAHVPKSPPDGGDVAMQLVTFVAEQRGVPTTPAKAN